MFVNLRSLYTCDDNLYPVRYLLIGKGENGWGVLKQSCKFWAKLSLYENKNSPIGLVQITLFWHFYGFLRFVICPNSGHLRGIYQSHYCASKVYFFFLYVTYLNIASDLYGKQIKSEFGNKLYLWMIFIFVHLNQLHLPECPTITLNVLIIWICYYVNLFTWYSVIYFHCLLF